MPGFLFLFQIVMYSLAIAKIIDLVRDNRSTIPSRNRLRDQTPAEQMSHATSEMKKIVKLVGDAEKNAKPDNEVFKKNMQNFLELKDDVEDMFIDNNIKYKYGFY